MSSVFNLSADLQITGPLKTEGHCTVYRGRRTGEILSAVKILAVPVEPGASAAANCNLDELINLKKLGRGAHPNVVHIADAGFSVKGGLPYVEMELVDGPALETLLQPPHEPVFTISETLKLAEQLAGALAYCHHLGIKHGRVEPSNIIFSQRTGNYVLVDFGFAALEPEQRRLSVPQIGNTGYLAPEQLEGGLLYQSDVYSFGLILFRLLTGKLPFTPPVPAAERKEPVALAAGLPLADVSTLRRESIPKEWSEAERVHEKDIPGWLVEVMYRCLERNTAKRFTDGTELHREFGLKIKQHLLHSSTYPEDTLRLLEENQKLLQQNEALQKTISKHQFYDQVTFQQLKELNENILLKDQQLEQLKQRGRGPALSRLAIYALLFIVLAGGGMAAYFRMTGAPGQPVPEKPVRSVTMIDTLKDTDNRQVKQPRRTSLTGKRPGKDTTASLLTPIQQLREPDTAVNGSTAARPGDSVAAPDESGTPDSENTGKPMDAYKVRSKAYFYDYPDENARRNAFIVHWNNAVLHPLNDSSGFVYIVFTNHLGQTSRGWLNKRDLLKMNQ